MGIFSFWRSYMFPNGYVILLSHYRMPTKVEKDERRTFRFAFIRRKIQTVFRSRALKTALLAELYGGKDAALVAQMVDRVTPLVKPPVQAVAPFLHKMRRRRRKRLQQHLPTHLQQCRLHLL